MPIQMTKPWNLPVPQGANAHPNVRPSMAYRADFRKPFTDGLRDNKWWGSTMKKDPPEYAGKKNKWGGYDMGPKELPAFGIKNTEGPWKVHSQLILQYQNSWDVRKAASNDVDRPAFGASPRRAPKMVPPMMEKKKMERVALSPRKTAPAKGKKGGKTPRKQEKLVKTSPASKPSPPSGPKPVGAGRPNLQATRQQLNADMNKRGVDIPDNEETNRAATKVQALQRGRKARQQVGKMKEGSKMFIKFRDCFAPFSQQSDAASKLRAEAWRAVDGNGSQRISLAEFDGWVQVELKKKYGNDEGDEVWRAFRASYIRAFKDASDISLESGDDDFVTKREFRVCITYLIVYANLYDAFTSIDGAGVGITGEDDDRVTLDEFVNCAAALKATPFVAFTSDTMDGREEEIFQEINTEGTMVLFKELCQYAERIEKEAGTELGKLLAIGEEDEGEETDV